MTQEVLERITHRVESIKGRYKETVDERKAGGSGSDAACELENYVFSLLDIAEVLIEGVGNPPVELRD